MSSAEIALSLSLMVSILLNMILIFVFVGHDRDEAIERAKPDIEIPLVRRRWHRSSSHL